MRVIMWQLVEFLSSRSWLQDWEQHWAELIHVYPTLINLCMGLYWSMSLFHLIILTKYYDSFPIYKYLYEFVGQKKVTFVIILTLRSWCVYEIEKKDCKLPDSPNFTNKLNQLWSDSSESEAFMHCWVLWPLRHCPIHALN